jgi:thiamine-phosphate pyrophosphorylase
MRDPRLLRTSLAVYVVTSAGIVPGRSHLDLAQSAIEGGATAIQLRAPELADNPQELVELALRIGGLCHEAGVLFIVNDYAQLGGMGDGLHLGQQDQLEGAREHLGPTHFLGVSVETVEQVREAVRLGADYLGVTVFQTATKPEATPVGLEGLRKIAASTPLPVVGIGGINASNARDVLAAGADGVAVVSAVGAAPDPMEATRELVRVVSGYLREHNSASK